SKDLFKRLCIFLRHSGGRRGVSPLLGPLGVPKIGFGDRLACETGEAAMSARLKALLAQNRVVRVFLMGQLCLPKLVETGAWHGGFDAVWFDQEHTGLTTPQIEDAARAARGSGIDCFVRLPATDYAAVMRPLEAGAGGVMASMVRSVREVENLVTWTKFHPRGLRGVNGSGVDGRYGAYPADDYYRRANAETFVAVQIEHYDAVEQVEKIAAVPDV